MRALLDIILLVLQIYIWLLIAAAVLSWLIAFNVVNTHNQVVATIAEFLFRITEPVLRSRTYLAWLHPPSRPFGQGTMVRGISIVPTAAERRRSHPGLAS